MRSIDLLHASFRGIRAHTGRSLLTMIGIVIGVMAIVLVISLGEGARNLIIQQVQSIGADVIVIRPGRQPEGPSDVAQTLFADSLTVRDVQTLRRRANVPGARLVEPLVFVSGSVSYREQIYRPEVFGWNAETLREMFDLELAEGTWFGTDDVRNRTNVAIIGARVKKELFGSDPAVGESIRIKQHAFRVVGVLEEGGQVGFLNMDEVVVIPSTIAQEDLLGIDYYHEIFVRVLPDVPLPDVVTDIEKTLRETHGISDPTKDDFFVVTQEDILERIGVVTRVLTLFLSAIAAISLLVGGVGIMNIMLVSVTERTREIGLRKAIGATGQDILRQFLLEALLLTFVGGIVGTGIAVALSAVITVILRTQFQFSWEFHMPFFAVMLGVGMAVTTGVIFGLYPALRASQKSPVEALRYE